MTKPTNKLAFSEEITEQQVVAYLEANPNFFLDNPDLLKTLIVPHPSGKAISLLEHQVNLFRKENKELHKRLSNLIAIARENDQLFDKTRRLIINLLAANSLEDIQVIIEEHFREQFKTDACCLLYFADQPLNTHGRTLALAEAKKQLGDILDSTKPITGLLKLEQKLVLFPDQAHQVGSAAVVPLYHQRLLGILAIGSEDMNHFRTSNGTLFLTHIGEVLSQLVYHFQEQSS
ncbi:DUF484 family protein [Spartinivicinus poritis]|uniref:DUF484 family protein n=1 Tax=Spartinivicinus poritis TaxID=2994640 RepID=A0ABT5UFU7_9GAMM|nr:DUF484 family protein [Spartinivicinus sp. A2-2]MDE1465264.1 DUF484 family protein [Spartinivicinus sp. A2-2]